MKFRRQMNPTAAVIVNVARPRITDEGRRAELALGMNILADVTWKLVLALSMLEEGQDLLDEAVALEPLQELADSLTTEVNRLLDAFGED